MMGIPDASAFAKRLKWNSPKHFLSHPRHLHEKRWRGRDTPLCCAATNERRDATQEAVPERSGSPGTGAATLSRATQGWEGSPDEIF